jgi:hypothetical protein
MTDITPERRARINALLDTPEGMANAKCLLCSKTWPEETNYWADLSDCLRKRGDVWRRRYEVAKIGWTTYQEHHAAEKSRADHLEAELNAAGEKIGKLETERWTWFEAGFVPANAADRVRSLRADNRRLMGDVERLTRELRGDVMGTTRSKIIEQALTVERQSLALWIEGRWDDEVKHRPVENIHRRTLDNTWRRIYRHVTGTELPRPVHNPDVSERPTTSDSGGLTCSNCGQEFGKDSLPIYMGSGRLFCEDCCVGTGEDPR